MSRAHAKGEDIGWVVHKGICYAGMALTIARRDAQQKRLPVDKRMDGWQPGRPMPGDGEFWWVEPHDGGPPQQQAPEQAAGEPQQRPPANSNRRLA